MDSKIVKFTLIFCFIFFNVNAAEFKGKFIQGHFIIGQTEPNSKIIIDKKEIKVSKDGYFVFGIAISFSGILNLIFSLLLIPVVIFVSLSLLKFEYINIAKRR